MSLIKLIKTPSKLFKKDVITFLIIRRHDLGIIEQRLRYVAVRPTASISKLRQKIWHLLDLPDYCDEIIILKANEEKEIPLTALCGGNDPQHPYIMEVWLPNGRTQPLFHLNVITMGDNKIFTEKSNAVAQDVSDNKFGDSSRVSFETHQDKDDSITRVVENKHKSNTTNMDHNRSDLSYNISNTSLFFKMPGIKSADNFACILLKIQSDLITLSNKLSQLENKIKF